MQKFIWFILITTLFFSFLPININAQVQNPIKLGIVLVDKDGQRQQTKKISTNEFVFETPMVASDSIRYQWEGIDLDLKYKDIPATGGGYLKIYLNSVSNENFLLYAGRENYPLKLSEFANKLKTGENKLLFVYENSVDKTQYLPVSLTFTFQPATTASVQITQPVTGTIFGNDLENNLTLELTNFSLENTNNIQADKGKIKIYYNQINENNYLGLVTNSQKVSENKNLVQIKGDQLDFKKIPDSADTKLIFVLTDGAEKPLGIQTEISVKTNFQNTLDAGIPSLKFVEPRKDRSDLTVDENTKFIVQADNFQMLTELKNTPDTNAQEGYLQIFIREENNTTKPIQRLWPKTEFSLKEIGYIAEKSGNRKIRIQLVNTNFNVLKTEAKDEIDIYFEANLNTENESVVQNNVWRLVIIGLTVILIVGLIIVVITKS